LEKLNDYVKAIEYFEILVRLEPKNSDFWNNLGVAYFYNENFHKALRCLKIAVNIDPKEGVLFNNLAVIYVNMEKLDKAKEALEQALDINKNNKFYWYYYAQVLYKQKEYNLSLQASERCLEINAYFKKAIEIKKKLINMLDKDDIANNIIENEQLKLTETLEKYLTDKVVIKAKDEARDEIEVFEAIMMRFILDNLKSHYNQDWWDNGIPGSIRKEVKRRLNIEKSENPHRTYENHEFLTLNDLKLIICYKKNWKNIFADIFYKKYQIQTLLENIINIRNHISHFREKFFEDDLKRLEVYLKDIYKFLI
jgi:tetratricopeptide (TPR) repeat protein